MTEPLLIAILIAVPPLIGVVSTALLARRLQPHTAAQSDALTLSTLQGTLANVLASQSTNLKDMDDLRKELASEKRLNEVTLARATAAEDRAQAAEQQVIALKQQVIDYPKRVIQLEAIITDLRAVVSDLRAVVSGLQAEIERLHEAAKAGAATAQLEAETRSTVAHTASTAPQQPPSLADDEKALGIPTDDLERVEELLYAELSGLTALLPASLRDGARLK